MKFLGNLGIDLGLLVAQIINFGLLLLILNHWVYKPIVKKIEEDEEKLKEAQKVKQDLEAEKQNFLTQKSQTEVSVKQHADQIISEAEKIASDIKNKAQLEAEAEKEAVIRQIKSRLNDLDYDNKR